MHFKCGTMEIIQKSEINLQMNYPANGDGIGSIPIDPDNKDYQMHILRG